MNARRHPLKWFEAWRKLGPTIPSLLSLGDAARTILHRWTVFAHLLGTLKTTSRALREVDGNTRQLFLVLSANEPALFVFPERGLGAGSFLSVPPTNPLVRFDSQIFRMLLLRRVRRPQSLSKLFCRCGRLIDEFGHPHATCAQEGVVLARRGYALESVVARVCREGGARVTTNMCVRDFDLDVPNAARDGRRLEVVADELPLFGSVQLAIDTTWYLLSTAKAQRGGVRKPPDVGKNGPTQNSFTAATTGLVWWCWQQRWGGRWSDEARSLIRALARARA